MKINKSLFLQPQQIKSEKLQLMQCHTNFIILNKY